jgi:aspartate kinase
MSRVVCKFGGSSLADAAQFKKVLAIIAADPRRMIVVPSAPGKRNSGDAKLTDLLYLCQQSASVGSDFTPVFERIRERFLEIERDLGVNALMQAHLEKLRADIARGVSKDHVASRGEHLNGLIMAACLDAEFIDPQNYITIAANGTIQADSYEKLGKALSAKSRRYVVPGFYGADAAGEIKTFSRGGIFQVPL